MMAEKQKIREVNKINNKPSFRIRATALEKMMYQVDHYHDGQCRCVIRFNGPVDVPEMAGAVELSLRVVPILGYKYVARTWQSYWEKGSASYTPVLFKQAETTDPEVEIHRFLSEPMCPDKGPQVSVCLIRSGNDVLCVKLTHLVVDAMGLLDYIRLLGKLYQQLRNDPGYTPPEAPAGNRGLLQVLRRAGIPSLIKGIFHWRYPKSQWGFPQVNSDLSGRAFPVRRISPEKADGFKTYCHDKDIKFTDVLIAAFYQALIDVLDPASGSLLPVQLPIDLRCYLPSGKADTICGLAGAYFPVIKHNSGKCFEDTLQDVAKTVSGAKAGEPWLGGALFLELMTLMPIFVQTRYARSIMKQELSVGKALPVLSNLGIVDPAIFNFGDLKAVDLDLFGPVAFPPSFLLTVYSFRGQLYLNSSYCPTAADPQLVDEFFNRFLDHLLSVS